MNERARPLSKIVDYDRSPFGRDPAIVPLISGDGARAYYRVGYLACAQDTAADLRGRRGANASAMPVLFLFRHYVELALKDILAAAGAFAIELVDRKFGHDLDALWQEAGKVFDNFGCQPTEEHCSLITELIELDGRADAFRYALDKRDQRQFERIGSVNLDTLVRAIDSTSTLFERLLDKMEETETEMDEMITEAIARDPY
ncbi:MAG: hypothetical protein J0I47_02075 [Sphingomonas sp.]|uniref:hypothetical protein n=1 Tax=Sphingomonas sp. TaxID=28214 RepID=UPI001AD01F63|nr:hypothetical protein [Sphingomonas sp.]MBN8807016.1 hypothetical protein [Sphingomonas sp.]